MSTKCLLSLCLRLLLAVAFLAGCSTSPTATPVPKQDLTTAPTLAPKTAAAATPVLTREASPTSEATPTPLPPLPPTVIEREPARGALQPPDRPLVLTFDQPMDQASVEATFQIEPMVEGAFHWSEDGRTLTFQPKEALARGREYTVTIGPEARSRQGLTMGAPLRFRFQTVGYLEVTGVFPAPDSSDVAGDTTVRVIFNRPVVPLTAIGAQQELPQAVQFSPAVKGTGRWINTSIFDFQPTARLAPGTTYTATVPQNLTDLSGAPLQEAFTWSFRTELPAVISVEPPDGARYVSPTPTLRLSFNQPMDRASVEVRFTLTRAGSDQALRGTFTWQDTTAIFTPTVALERGADYVARLAEGASAATAGAGKAPAFEWHFAVAPEPRVSRIQPADGATRVPLGEGLHIEFTSPISREAFSKYLIIEPKAQYYPFWHDDDTQVELSTFLRPSTRYTVTLPSDIVDRFGTPLRQARTIHFETAPYDPMVFIRTQGRVGTYNAYAEPTIYVEYRNVSQVDLALYHLTPQSFVNLNAEESWRIWDKFRPQTTDLIRRWSREVDSPLNQRRILSQTLTTEEGRPLAPGLYYLEVSSPDRKQDIQKHLLVVTTLNLVLKTSQDKLLVWATDLKSGEPVADVSLMVYNGKGRQSSTMTTDAEGLALGPMPPQDPWSPIVVLARKGEAVSAVLRYWSSGISPWEFGLSSEPMRQEYRAYFYTDRRIYRPGQKVYFKGIVRRDQDAQYALPSANTPVEITARDNQGREFWKQTLRISDMGTIDGEIQLAESAPLGFYQLQGRLGEQFFGTDFQVAEYRRPEFQVSVTLDKNDYINGSTIKAIAEAGYFFGGPVAEAQVFWRVLSEPYYFDRWQGKGYYSFTEPEEDGFQPRLSPFGGLVAEGRGKTDAEGRFRFSLPADISEHKLSRRYTVEVSVVDLNNQEVSARSGAIVHKGNFYIGLAALRYVGTVGQEMPVQAITVDTRGITRTQQTLETVFYRHEWFSVREQADDGNFYWTTQVRDTPLVTKTVTTDAQGQATASFVPPEGGTYKVVAYGQDEFGNEVRSALFLWVSDRAFVHWGQRNDDRITLVADQKAYRPGDTAKILVPSPYQGETLALLTLERGSILEQRLIRLASNSEILELPIKPEYAPNVFISVTLVRGMQNDELPGFKMGYVMLPVSTEQKELQITLTSDRARYKPRDEAVFTIETRDYQGQGVPAEVSLQLVDLAIESLVGGAQTNILETFYRQRGLGVQSATTLAVLVDRQNLQTAQEGKGGGGGGEGEGLVRQEFPETAYWAPAVRTDASGRAQVTVRLPDTLTTWRMTAQAVTADTKVGVQRADITTTLEVLVRPVAPRFLVIGDKPVLGAIAHNNTDRTLEMTVTAQAQGVALERNEQTVTVPAGGQVKTAWPGVVQAVSEAILELRVSGGGHQDALRLTLPVYPPSAPEVVGTSGQVEGSVLEVVHVPEGADLTQGELKVTLEPSLAAGMSEGLGYLRAFPYDCIEQTVSRFLPNVVTYRAMRELGIENPKLAAQLPQQVGVALQRLYELQNPDGGWGWWARGESSPALTAYVILGLHEARRSDFAVDQQVVDRGVSFLYNWLDGKAPDTRRYRDERATVLYMLAEAGGAEYGDLGRTVALYEKRGDMSLYAKAYLAMALHILDADETTRRQTLVNELMDAAIVSAAGAHWEEPERGYWDMNTDARTTAIVLRALVRLSPENALLPNAVRWLMAARESGRWETTQENVWAILALTDYMVATGELQADYRYELWVNDSRLATGETAPENIDEVIQVKVPMDKLRAKAPNLLRISRAAKGQQDMTGKLYYSAFLRYFLPAERIQALDRGIVVYRNYYRMEDVGTEKDPRALAPGAEPIEAAQVGDTILVRLTLIAPNDLYFLVLEDPLPAGCEAIDTSLQTTASTTFGPQMEREKEEGSSGSYRHDWYYYWATHAELHDEKVVLSTDYLPRGTYEYTYSLRCTTPGMYQMMPARAYEMYFPDTFGQTAGGIFQVREK